MTVHLGRASSIIAGILLCMLSTSALPDSVAMVSAGSSSKIGFVNTERILHDSYPAKQAQERLRIFFSQHSEHLKQMERDLEVLKSRLEKQGPRLSEEQRHQLEIKFNQESAEFQKAQRQANEALDAERNEEYQTIIDRANAVIKKIADRDHYDIIFQEAVYVSGRVDITDAVICALAKKPEKMDATSVRSS